LAVELIRTVSSAHAVSEFSTPPNGVLSVSEMVMMYRLL
jgi:hypothetical protein